MNAAQIHLGVNHLPVILPGVGLLIVTFGLFWHLEEIKKLGLWIVIISALIAILVFLTGEPAENVMKNYPDISRLGMHLHEESAKISLVIIECVGIFSLILVGFKKFQKKVPRSVWGGYFIFSLVSFFMMARTAHLGGQIRHEEIQTQEQLESTAAAPLPSFRQ
jgi:uncharacterized membrane protein